MAQIQRKRHFEDTLELLDESGNVCVTLPISLNIEEIYVKVHSARRAVANAEAALRQNETEETIKAYGEAIVFLFSAVFGEDGAEKIVRHYENNYGEMLLDILPYLIATVFPKIDELSTARLKQAVELRRAADKAAAINRTRQHQRKRFGKRHK